MKPTDLAIVHVFGDGFKKGLKHLSVDASPWVLVSNPSDEIEFFFKNAGTDIDFAPDLKFTVHVWLKRTKA